MRDWWRRQEGSIYVEALVAIAILAIALIPLIGTFAITPGAQSQASQESTAMNLARARLEELHGLTGAQWDALGDSATTTESGGRPYTIQTQVAGSGDAELDPYLKRVWVTVSWSEAKGTPRQVVLATSVARRP